MKSLVLAAHPDDEVFGRGGTSAKLTQEQHEVYISILGEGATSRHSRRERAAAASALATLREQCRRAAGLLDATEVFFSSLADNRFDTVPLLDVVKIIEELVERGRPRAVYTHHGEDLNIDHAGTLRAILTATQPLAGTPVRELYSYELPSATEWALGQFAPPFRPTMFEEFSDTIGVKLKALKVYQSEVRPFLHPRSTEALEAIARRLGERGWSRRGRGVRIGAKHPMRVRRREVYSRLDAWEERP